MIGGVGTGLKGRAKITLVSPFLDREGNPIGEDEAIELLESPERVIAKQWLEGVEISTVHTVINYSTDPERPEHFETMLFGGPHSRKSWRYATYEGALEGHKTLVLDLREQLNVNGATWAEVTLPE